MRPGIVWPRVTPENKAAMWKCLSLWSDDCYNTILGLLLTSLAGSSLPQPNTPQMHTSAAHALHSFLNQCFFIRLERRHLNGNFTFTLSIIGWQKAHRHTFCNSNCSSLHFNFFMIMRIVVGWSWHESVSRCVVCKAESPRSDTERNMAALRSMLLADICSPDPKD